MIRQQAAAAGAEFPIAFLRRNPVNQLNSRPYPAGILPTASRSPQPFAQNGARRHQTAVILTEAAGERADLLGGAHAQGNEAGQKCCGHGQARAAGNIINLADDFDTVAGKPRQMSQYFAERLRGPFHPGWYDAGGNYRGLEQTQVVVSEIENFRNGAEFGARLKVNTDQAQHRLIDNAEPCFDGRLGSPRASHAQVDGNVEHAGALGKIHPQKENIAPPAMAQVHADRHGLA